MSLASNKNTPRAFLEELKRPWSASQLTPAQEQSRVDIVTAKPLWNSTLNEFRNKRQPTTKTYNLKSTKQPFFPFLDLPPEIRNQIYDICLNDENDERNPDMTPMSPERSGPQGSREKIVYNAYQNRVRHIRSSTPTPAQLQRDTARRALLDKSIHRNLKQAEKMDKLTSGACEAFETYRLEHEMYTTLPWHDEKKTYANEGESQNIFDDSFDGEKKSVAIVNPRGNLMDDLPILSLVDRQLFQDTFHLFYSTTREGLWIKWVIRNSDFFPFLRFYQALTTGLHPVAIAPSRLHIEYDEQMEDLDEELHVDTYTTLSDAELVETVIDLLCGAIVYHLGYEGNYLHVGRDGSQWGRYVFEVFRYKGTHRKTAYAMEHAWVHVVGQYRDKMDKELRAHLVEAYEEWEKLPDEEGIPEGVLL